MCNDIFDTIMSSGAALRTNPKLPRCQIDIIVNNDQFLLRIDLVIIHQLPDTLSAEIHIGLRHRQKNLLSLDHTFATDCLMLFDIHGNPVSIRQHRQRRKTDIVTGAIVFPFRIS